MCLVRTLSGFGFLMTKDVKWGKDTGEYDPKILAEDRGPDYPFWWPKFELPLYAGDTMRNKAYTRQ